jgi:hypothetical protein
MLHVGTRTCSRCRVEKPLNRHHFYRRTRDPFGYQRMCIASTRADLDRADAARRQARQAARAEALRAEQAAAVGGRLGYYPPYPPHNPDDEDAREEYRQACLAWVIHRRADDVVAALDTAAWDGAASPIDAIADAVFHEAPEDDPEDPLYCAWDYLTELVWVHADRLVEEVPEANRPALAAIFPEWCRPKVSAAEAPASG